MERDSVSWKKNLLVAKVIQSPKLNRCVQIVQSAPNHNQPVGRVVTRSFLKREVCGSNLGLVKLDELLPATHHRCSFFSKKALLSMHNDAEFGSENSLHGSALNSRYNEKFNFDLIYYSIILTDYNYKNICFRILPLTFLMFRSLNTTYSVQSAKFPRPLCALGTW